MMKKYKEFMFAPDELPVYMADPKVFFYDYFKVKAVVYINFYSPTRERY